MPRRLNPSFATMLTSGLVALVCIALTAPAFARESLSSLRNALTATQAPVETAEAAANRAQRGVSANAADISTLQIDLVNLGEGLGGLTSEDLTTQIAAVWAQLDALKARPAFDLEGLVRVDTTSTLEGVAPPHVIFEGANVHIRSDSGRTDDFDSGNGVLLTGLSPFMPVSPGAGEMWLSPRNLP